METLTTPATCPDCGSPMVLGCDEFMLGTLECPECCCETEDDPEEEQSYATN